ncbi:hypothetical protein WISP_146870 [Willisornis vidua]|uniref:Uncharacterized protein n=1 Tax=Willisornis vidua TaxID=1566151 RepID=A0ABQ9CQZ3_9PASS|nr:hypothetical protein WISP_146870 [Willisornis vidua]
MDLPLAKSKPNHNTKRHALLSTSMSRIEKVLIRFHVDNFWTIQRNLTDVLYEILDFVVVMLTLCVWSLERKVSKDNSAKAKVIKDQTKLAPINTLEFLMP